MKVLRWACCSSRVSSEVQPFESGQSAAVNCAAKRSRSSRYRQCRRSGWPTGSPGCSNSSDSRMPRRSITARERRFSIAVKDTISRKVEAAEPDLERGPRSFAGQALAPVSSGQTPADFHARREWQGRRRRMQAYEADECASSLQLDGPESPAALFDQRLAAVSHRVALGTAEQCGKVPHDPRVRIHRGEGGTIGWLPLPQEQARGVDLVQISHCGRLVRGCLYLSHAIGMFEQMLGHRLVGRQ